MGLTTELNEREVEIIRVALHERRRALNEYVRWIDDRPMLPERAKAIETVRSESLEVFNLSVKLTDAKDL